MGMYGCWARITSDELARARADPGGLTPLLTDDHACDDNRFNGTDKAWHAFAYLLDRRGLDDEIVYGSEPFEGAADWGYGPPRYLPPVQVAACAAALAGLTEESLADGVEVTELAQANLYPSVWDDASEIAWVTHYLPYVQEYFALAAKEGDAVVCWIS
ncbi:MAG: DUF1877 family protein [Actinoplanes sp.]